MITVELARSLRTAGLTWAPAPGDRFVIDQPELVGQSFFLSDLTVDLHSFRGQQLLGFNGTVEWALDSVTIEEALWLPHEHQLRAALGRSFTRLESVGSAQVRVVLDVEGAAIEFVSGDASSAYGRALLHLLTR